MFGPILTLCYFIPLVLSGLSCWSFSGWADHCVCLPDVPRSLRCRNLAGFKETKRKSELICSRKLSFSLCFSSALLFPCRVLSSFVVSCVVSCLLSVSPFFPLLVSVFPCKEENRNIKGEGRHSCSVGFAGLLLQSESLQLLVAVDGCQRFLQSGSYRIRQEAQTKTLQRSDNVSEVSVRSMWSIGANDCLESVSLTW